MNPGLEGRVAVVGGSSSGLGFSVAASLAADLALAELADGGFAAIVIAVGAEALTVTSAATN